MSTLKISFTCKNLAIKQDKTTNWYTRHSYIFVRFCQLVCSKINCMTAVRYPSWEFRTCKKGTVVSLKRYLEAEIENCIFCENVCQYVRDFREFLQKNVEDWRKIMLKLKIAGFNISFLRVSFKMDKFWL